MDNACFSLEGKVALVTGGSRGIGKAIALLFADAGADVAISSRKLPDLQNVAEEIKRRARRSLAVSAHSGRMEELRNLVARVKEEFGRIDILVNTVGANPVMASVLQIEESAFDLIMNVNIKGCFFLSQLAANMMVHQGGGVIINISTEGAYRPYTGLGAYCISKAAVIMMTKVMASELGDYNIRVNAIAPGTVDTQFVSALTSDKDAMAKRLAHTPLRRIGQPEEVARGALYLASDASSFMTGETILLDGGASI